MQVFAICGMTVWFWWIRGCCGHPIWLFSHCSLHSII